MGQAGVAFRSLLAPRSDERPGDTQQRAADRLPGLVAESRMGWWRPGDPIPPTGHRLLIGVAVWSGYDLRLLDYIDAALPAAPAGLSVDVFDMDTAREPDWFEPYIPGLGDVSNTPVAGLWDEGRLVRRGTGHEARIIVAELFALDLSALSAFRSTPAAA